MNIAIVGSRDFADIRIIARSIARWQERAATSGQAITVVSGGARGADSIGERLAKRNGVPTIIHLPQWEKYGKSAGFRRNDLIVRDADVVLAFFAPGPRSRGTANTVASAKLAGKAVYEYHEGKWYAHETLDLSHKGEAELPPDGLCPHCGEGCETCAECDAERSHYAIPNRADDSRFEDEYSRTDARGVLDPC